MLDWLFENKVAAAYTLGALTATLYVLLVLADLPGTRAGDAPEGAEVKHGRRAGRAA